jgi:predicted DNA-binding transcriptional regulator AlpA
MKKGPMWGLETTAVEGTAPEAVFVRISTVTLITGLGRSSSIYRLVAQDKFPSPVKLTKKGCRMAPRRSRNVGPGSVCVESLTHRRD